MTDQLTPAVLYAAKSTEDTHGSIPTQIEDCRAMAEREGWTIVGEFSDEGFSAFHGNRGPGLENAKRIAIDAASEHGRCVLVAQDSDRFARGAGDAPGAADHLGEVYFAMKRQSVELWSVRSRQLDLLRAALEGERAHDETARKAQAVHDGYERRKEAGKANGRVAFGYRLQPQVVNGAPVVEKGYVVNDRVADPVTSAILFEAFAMVEHGGVGYGDVARALNARGVLTTRGKSWSREAVKYMLHNPIYVGERGYPRLVSDELWQAVQDQLGRVDAAAVQRRKGGRPSADAFTLHGVLFCAVCGAPMWTRSDHGRRYQCRNARRNTGLCTAPPIPATVIEKHVLRHLSTFIGSVEDWLGERAAQRTVEQQQREAVLDRERAALADLDKQRTRHFAEYDKLVAAGSDVAHLALERVAKFDADRERQQQRIAEAEAVAAEWSGPPDLDAALDFYNGLVDLTQGRVAKAQGALELNAALHDVLAGVWVKLDEGRLHAWFQLRDALGDDPKRSGLAQAMGEHFSPQTGRAFSLPTETLTPALVDLDDEQRAAWFEQKAFEKWLFEQGADFKPKTLEEAYERWLAERPEIVSGQEGS